MKVFRTSNFDEAWRPVPAGRVRKGSPLYEAIPSLVAQYFAYRGRAGLKTRLYVLLKLFAPDDQLHDKSQSLEPKASNHATRSPKRIGVKPLRQTASTSGTT